MSSTPEDQPPAPTETSSGASSDAPAETSRRTALLLVGALVVIGIGMAALNGALTAPSGTSEGVADVDGAPQECDPTPEPGGGQLGGLEVPEGPDALAAGVMCAFEDDRSVPIAEYLGDTPVVLNFWATWCEPCRDEMPDFQQVHEAADGQFQLIGINHQDAPRLARDFAAELGITYEMLRDPSGRYLRANGGFGMPTTLFVAPDGEVRYRQTGPIDRERFAELLDEHFDLQVTFPS